MSISNMIVLGEVLGSRDGVGTNKRVISPDVLRPALYFFFFELKYLPSTSYACNGYSSRLLQRRRKPRRLGTSHSHPIDYRRCPGCYLRKGTQVAYHSQEPPHSRVQVVRSPLRRPPHPFHPRDLLHTQVIRKPPRWSQAQTPTPHSRRFLFHSRTPCPMGDGFPF